MGMGLAAQVQFACTCAVSVLGTSAAPAHPSTRSPIDLNLNSDPGSHPNLNLNSPPDSRFPSVAAVQQGVSKTVHARCSNFVNSRWHTCC